MNLSGILVVVEPDRTEASIQRLDALPGVSVHHWETITGRIVVTQEAESIDAEVEGLKRIKALDNVLLAEMVYHYFEDDDVLTARMPAGLDEVRGLDGSKGKTDLSH